MKVFCYRNLRYKTVMWSVRSCKTGRVVTHQPLVILKNCELKVSKAGRVRVLKEKRKNVHAGIQGEKMPIPSRWSMPWRRVEYNPYLYESFVYSDTKEPVKFAEFVKLSENGCWVSRD